MALLLMAALAGLSLPLINAAKIKGAVYSFSLEKVTNARVEINTTPHQVFISRNATYQFYVPKGAYLLNATVLAKPENGQVQEIIDIRDDGEYTLDLILFPRDEEDYADVDEPLEIENGLFEPQNRNQKLPFLLPFLIGILVVAGGIFGVFIFLKNPLRRFLKKGDVTENSYAKENFSVSADDDRAMILRILAEHGRRMTQKDLRKKMPYSEAKISLALAELEKKGAITKIKKGRGNIIILK